MSGLEIALRRGDLLVDADLLVLLPNWCGGESRGAALGLGVATTHGAPSVSNFAADDETESSLASKFRIGPDDDLLDVAMSAGPTNGCVTSTGNAIGGRKIAIGSLDAECKRNRGVKKE